MITIALILALQTTPVVGSGNGSGNIVGPDISVVSSDIIANTNTPTLVSPPFFTGRIPAGCAILVEKGWVIGAVCPVNELELREDAEKSKKMANRSKKRKAKK